MTTESHPAFPRRNRDHAGTMGRRQFIQISSLAGAGLLIGVQLALGKAVKPTGAAPEVIFEPNLFIKISNTGKVIIQAKNPEIGQGVMTSLPMLIAEELEVNWQDVEVQQAPLNSGFQEQVAAGSSAMRNHFETLRKAGAAARQVLVEAAAKRWQVSFEECYAHKGAVHRRGTDQQWSYAQLVDESIREVIVPEFPHLKDPRDFTLIGKAVPGVENPNIVTGKALFGIDARPAGTLIATLERCPVFGGKVKSFDAAKTLQVPGVVQVVEITSPEKDSTLGGVAVVASNTWAALQGKKALQVTWDFAGGETESDATIAQQMEDALRSPTSTPKRNDGDVETAFLRSTKHHAATYQVPYWAHATMEPMNYTAHVQADRVDLIGPTQVPQAVREKAVRLTGIPAEKIHVTMTRVGGGFGRRLETDYAAEAILVSKAIGKPVQVVWTREDDFAHDHYNPKGICQLKAGLDDRNQLLTWEARATGFFWGDSFPAAFVPHFRVYAPWVTTNIPLGAWRGPGHNVTAFYLQSFLDELAALAGRDPVDFQLDLLGKSDRIIAQNTYGDKLFSTARMRRVIELVVEKSGWYLPLPKGVFRGFAQHFTFGSYAAKVIWLSMPSPGTIRIEKVVAALDCGRIINRSGAIAQVEGGIIDGLSVALHGAIHIEGGRVQESSFDNYPLLRMPEAPRSLEVHFVESQEHPMGLGEVSLPPVIPALCNALYAATGQRFRTLPIAVKAGV